MKRCEEHTRVVGLTEVAEQTSSGGGVDNATILLLLEVRPCGTGDLWHSSIIIPKLRSMPSYLECASHVHSVD
jgi:hypothetical protein